MKETERILKALANRRRLAILKFLKEHREASVGDVASAIKLSFKATSKHLAILDKVDLVQREQRGLSVFYSLASDQKSFVKSILSTL